MKCLFPKYALLPIGSFAQEKFGKRPLFKSKDVWLNYKENIIPDLSFTGEPMFEPIEIGCGTCVNCKANKALDWSIRMTCESMMYPAVDIYADDLDEGHRNWFVTLTYDEVWCPRSHKNLSLRTLEHDHVSSFVKRLRRYFEYHYPDHPPLRVYSGSEYGEKSHRPHYHLIIFDMLLKDVKYFYKNFQGDRFYTSKILQDKWKFGNVVASPFSMQNALYTSSYTSKKLYGQKGKEIYNEAGLEPESSRMSRATGIGMPYFYAYQDKIFPNGSVTLPNGHVFPPPKVFVTKYEEIASEDALKEWYRVKAKRMEAAMASLQILLDKVCIPEEQYFLDVAAEKERSKRMFVKDRLNYDKFM